MARPEKSPKPRKSRLKRVKGAVSRTAKKVATKLEPAKKRAEKRAQPAAPRPARPPRRESDIPLEVLDRTYTPTQTSLKASFRVTGEDRQRDQELAEGFADERWGDEDHFTNKSGDPRIGTHRRKYEPNE
jgi:hypothetical protein